jgi:hypothetical protein
MKVEAFQMKLVNLMRIVLAILCLLLAYVLLIPSVPSEKIPPTNVNLLKPNMLIPGMFFWFFCMALRERFKIFTFCHGSIIKFFGLMWFVFFLLHVLLRIILWNQILSAYGNPMFNVFIHSIVYSLMMSAIFCLSTFKTRK